MTQVNHTVVSEVIKNLPWSDGIRAITAARFARRFEAEDPEFVKDEFMKQCGFYPVAGRPNVYRRNEQYVSAT